MTIEEIINLLNNKLIFLNNTRNVAIQQGDLSQLIELDRQISDRNTKHY